MKLVSSILCVVLLTSSAWASKNKPQQKTSPQHKASHVQQGLNLLSYDEIRQLDTKNRIEYMRGLSEIWSELEKAAENHGSSAEQENRFSLGFSTAKADEEDQPMSKFFYSKDGSFNRIACKADDECPYAGWTSCRIGGSCKIPEPAARLCGRGSIACGPMYGVIPNTESRKLLCVTNVKDHNNISQQCLEKAKNVGSIYPDWYIDFLEQHDEIGKLQKLYDRNCQAKPSREDCKSWKDRLDTLASLRACPRVPYDLKTKISIECIQSCDGKSILTLVREFNTFGAVKEVSLRALPLSMIESHRGGKYITRAWLDATGGDRSLVNCRAGSANPEKVEQDFIASRFNWVAAHMKGGARLSCDGSGNAPSNLRFLAPKATSHPAGEFQIADGCHKDFSVQFGTWKVNENQDAFVLAKRLSFSPETANTNQNFFLQCKYRAKTFGKDLGNYARSGVQDVDNLAQAPICKQDADQARTLYPQNDGKMVESSSAQPAEQE